MEYFNEAMKRIQQIHDKKAYDYTSEGEFDNFADSALAAGIRVDQAIEVMIATKESRRRNLEVGAKVPKNESIEDTLLDRAVYSIIRYAHYLSEKPHGINRDVEREIKEALWDGRHESSNLPDRVEQ